MIKYLLVLSSAVIQAAAPVDPCLAICDSTVSCASDAQEHSSYCKYYQSPPVCFGLYNLVNGSIGYCFQPNDPACNEGSPVLCPGFSPLI